MLTEISKNANSKWFSVYLSSKVLKLYLFSCLNLRILTSNFWKLILLNKIFIFIKHKLNNFIFEKLKNIKLFLSKRNTTHITTKI